MEIKESNAKLPKAIEAIKKILEKDLHVLNLWNEFANVPVNDNDEIDEDFF